MSDQIYPPEQVPESTATPDIQAMDAQVTEAQAVDPGSTVETQPASDNTSLKNEIPEQKASSAVEADSRIDKAQDVSSRNTINTDKSDLGEQQALSGQMTDTPQFNQGNKPDCLLQSGRMAEAEQLGKDPGLEEIKQGAINDGNYDGGEQGGVKSMEKFSEQMNQRPGLESSYSHGNNLEDIKSSLDKNESVIVNVDAAKFYPELGLEPNSGGHAVVITEANPQPEGDWKILVNDPNEFSPNKPVNSRVFTDAWNENGSEMITVRKAGGSI